MWYNKRKIHKGGSKLLKSLLNYCSNKFFLNSEDGMSKFKVLYCSDISCGDYQLSELSSCERLQLAYKYNLKLPHVVIDVLKTRVNVHYEATSGRKMRETILFKNLSVDLSRMLNNIFYENRLTCSSL